MSEESRLTRVLAISCSSTALLLLGVSLALHFLRPAARRTSPVSARPSGEAGEFATDERDLPQSARARDLGVRLIGTVTGSSPAQSSATLLDLDRSIVLRTVGETVAGGMARIAEIAPRSVALSHPGGLELLEFEPARAAETDPSELASPRHEPRLAGAPRNEPAEVDPLSALAALAKMGEFSNAEGSGMQVDRLERNSPLARCGLRPGDQIADVDGVQVRSAQQGRLALARSLRAAGSLTLLSVIRFDGARVQIAVDGTAFSKRDSTR